METRDFECDNGRVYRFPARHCAFCRYCTHVLYDYSHGPYLFLCDIGAKDYRTCGKFCEEESEEMSSCSKCIFKPFCQSPGPACSSFKDKDRYADRNEVIREFAERLKANMSNIARMEYGGNIYFCVGYGLIDTLVKEMTDKHDT